MGFKKHWDIFRELFVAKWVDRLGEVEMKEKRLALLRHLNPLEAGTLALDVFFTVLEVEPDTRPATEGENQREENGVPSFNWADDVDTTVIPTTRLVSPVTRIPCDFSGLCLSTKNPWESLNCCHHRSHPRTQNLCHSHKYATCGHAPQPPTSSQLPLKPPVPVPVQLPVVRTMLPSTGTCTGSPSWCWSRDPLLAGLSRVWSTARTLLCFEGGTCSREAWGPEVRTQTH
ncbi:hypothetical protein BKA82DRAFT_4248239 [Pisolithus tinctorius]|nr:hypothetical protein BKA82DRAFT_4248239 [Pisolithus tinctorius]